MAETEGWGGRGQGDGGSNGHSSEVHMKDSSVVSGTGSYIVDRFVSSFLTHGTRVVNVVRLAVEPENAQ